MEGMTCSVVDLVCRRRLVLGSVAGVGYVGGRDSSSLLKPLQMIRRYHSGGEGFDLENDGAWSPEEVTIPAVLHCLPSSLLFCGYVWGGSSLGVVARAYELHVAASGEFLRLHPRLIGELRLPESSSGLWQRVGLSLSRNKGVIFGSVVSAKEVQSGGCGLGVYTVPGLGGLEAAISKSPSRTTAPPIIGLLLVQPVCPQCFKDWVAFLSGSSRQPKAQSAHTSYLGRRRCANFGSCLGLFFFALNRSLLSSPFFQSNLPQLPPSSSSTSQKVRPVPAPPSLPPAVKRDLSMIMSNLKLVVFPNPNREDFGKAFRDWDLWEPFFFKPAKLSSRTLVSRQPNRPQGPNPSSRDSAGSVLRQGFCVSGNPERLRSTADSFVQSLEGEKDANFPQEGVVCGGALSYKSFNLQGSMRVHHHNPNSRPLEGDDLSMDGGSRRKFAALQRKIKWKFVSEVLFERGYHVSPQLSEDKFNDLNKRFKKLNENRLNMHHDLSLQHL
uniref:Uncharacterized protein n=1 Tax=Brassica oleracea var. oleracea TaxID=109376 RepID=A0A0D3E781_BRAOL